MTHSQLINIKSKKIEINYHFSINKNLKFRFITPQNLNGVKLNTQHVTIENNSSNDDQFWYRYTEDLNFCNLNKYRYLVLQLYAEKVFFTDYNLIENKTYSITNKNEWFKCSDYESCNINFFNQMIIIDKPLQEVNEYLRYKITGNAKLIKNKYLLLERLYYFIDSDNFC